MKLFATYYTFDQTQSVPIFSTYCAPISSPYQGRYPMDAGQMNLATKPMICWSSAWYISWLYLLLTTLWVNSTGQVWGQTISTVAGNGLSGFSGDNGPATSASLNFPTHVVVDSVGNLYIVDQSNNRIRQVSIGTGHISTIAGNGSSIFDGDGKAATSSSLYASTEVVLGKAGDFYFTDQGNHRIRKVTASTGLISTVAGTGAQGFSGDNGSATSANLDNPTGLVMDRVGNLYFADQGNNRIRKVSASTGLISTVAGNGTSGFSGDKGLATSASLNFPNGITLDGEGNLYFTDMYNHRVRKVAASTGLISTVAGTGNQGFSGDNGLATSAHLNYPGGITLDEKGNLYFTDRGNHRVRKVIASTGLISTVAGNGLETFSYFGDDGIPATSASLSLPYGVAMDRAGNLYIADQGHHRIRKVTPNTAPTVVTTIPSQTATTGHPFSYSLPGGIFTDAETPNALILSVSSLPAGLIFTAPATISGTPTTATGSPASLTVTATDPGGLTVSTTLTLTVQPEIIDGADLTPTLNLSQANFTASGSGSVRNLTMTIQETINKATSGVIVLTLTAPLGYSLSFDPALTSINVSGGTTNPVPVNNANWEVQFSSSRQLTLASKAGRQISGNGSSVIGVSLTRAGASTGSSNLTVNVNDDATKGYDSNSANNIYVRILNAL